MKRLVICFASIAYSVAAFADVSGEFVKNNAGVEIKQQGDSISFSINSSVGDNVCNLNDDDKPLVAQMIDANRAVWSSNDRSNKCTVLFNFTSGHLKLTTKDCDSYCGMNAIGSMDGTYKLKKTKEKVIHLQ